MYSQLLLLVYLSIILSLGQCQGVTEEETEKRIIGGNPAESPSQFPYIVSIVKRKGDRVVTKLCTGTIINANAVLTAAHCCAELGNREAYVVAGVTDAFDLENAAIRKIKSCIPHPNYTHKKWGLTRRASPHDVALIKLHNPLPFSKHVGSIQLASPDAERSKKGTSLGFGVTGNPPHENENTKLNYVETPIISDTECHNLWGSVEGIFCSGEKFATTCWGDSGGPMVSNINDQPSVLGVISMGPFVCGDKPTVYTDMQHKSNYEWVTKCMNTNDEC